MPRRLPRAIVALTACGVLTLAPSGAAFPWSNGGPGDGPADQGNGYGTHDWVIDQGLRTAGARGAWLDIEIARRASDDPDAGGVDREGDQSHLFREVGRGRGAVQKISDYYTRAQLAYAAGDIAHASRYVGLLAHYYADIGQPYHSAYAGLGKKEPHQAYEALVDHEVHARTAAEGAARRHDWTSPRQPILVGNIRTKAINLAASSRRYYPQLDAAMAQRPPVLNSTLNGITDDLLSRISNGLGDIIATIPTRYGQAPNVASLRADMRVHYPGRGDGDGVYVWAKDGKGSPIEGLAVDVAWPTASGSISHQEVYTDAAGYATYAGPVGDTPYMSKRVVRITAATNAGTARSASASTSTWFMATPRLATALAGFSTSVSTYHPSVGGRISARSTTTDTSGRPVHGLRVVYSWGFPSGTVTSVGYTDATGHASASATVPESARGVRVRVEAKLQAGGRWRNSSATFTAR